MLNARIEIMPLLSYDHIQSGFRRADVTRTLASHTQLLNLQEHVGPPGVVLWNAKQYWIARYLQNASHSIDSHSAWDLQFVFYVFFCFTLRASCEDRSSWTLTFQHS